MERLVAVVAAVAVVRDRAVAVHAKHGHVVARKRVGMRRNTRIARPTILNSQENTVASIAILALTMFVLAIAKKLVPTSC
jgi:hypothetical protein